ncbi:MAG: hypothetical protein AAFZ87_05815, partial [Planctomycetota bacterium]
MPRRRVTMLEAFQASARKSALEAASQKRRAADERERDAKRADAIKTTQLWLGRIGDGVGSLWSGLRGEDASPGPETATRREAAVVPFDRRPPPPAHEPRPDGAEAGSAEAGSGAQAPPAASPDAAGVEGSSERSEGALRPPLPRTPASEVPGPGTSGAGDAPDPTADPTADAAAEQLGFEEGAAERRAEREAVEAALRSNGETAFALPITGRAFAAVVAVLLGVVFALGFRLGSGDPAEAAAPVEETGSRGLARIELTAPPSGAGPADARRTAGASRVPAPAGGASSAPGSSARRSSGEAAEPSAGEPSAGGRSAPAASAAVRAADAAFDDPRNRYSILAVTYAATRTNEKLAWEAYDQLAAAGLPVVSPVLDSADRKIFLFVGATEAEAQLRPLLNDVKAVETGPRR